MNMRTYIKQARKTGFFLLALITLILSCNKETSNATSEQDSTEAMTPDSTWILGPDSILVPPPPHELADSMKADSANLQIGIEGILMEHPEYIQGDWFVSEVSGQPANSEQLNYSLNVQIRADNTIVINDNGSTSVGTYSVSGNEINIVNADGTEQPAQIVFISESQMIVNTVMDDENGHDIEVTLVFDRP